MKIKKNVPMSLEEGARKRWPFRDMEIKDTIDIDDKKLWPVTAKAAHSYARSQGWKVTTRWLDELNVGRIRRVG